MKTQTSKGKYANIYLHILGYLLCIIPPLACALTYFPLWENGGGSRLNALCAVAVILSVFPIIKLIRRLLRSDATYVFWFILFISFWALSRIADEMTVISFVGFISNSIGAMLMRMGGRKNGKQSQDRS